jgi:hypothetical protein
MRKGLGDAAKVLQNALAIAASPSVEVSIRTEDDLEK